MRSRRWALLGWFLVGVAATGLGIGCSSDKSTNSGGSGTPTGNYLIEAYFSKTTQTFATFSAAVIRLEPSDTGADEAQVYVNGDQIQQTPLISTAEEAFYTTASFDYVVGEEYVVEVKLGDRTATCTFTAPECLWPEITSPADNGSYVPGEALGVSWEYGGSAPEKVTLTVYANTGEEDDYEYMQEFDGTTTSHQIPVNETTTWTTFDEVIIGVDLGAQSWSFTGDLASPGSYTGTVLKGTAVSLSNAATAHWNVLVTTGEYELEADGQSTTTVTVDVDSDSGANAPDGSEVVFTLDPSGRGSISPQTTQTTDGTATAVFTAGTTTGTVTITATCRGSEGYGEIELVEVGGSSYDISVGTGAQPVINWTPAGQMVSLVVTAASGTIGEPIWSIAPLVTSFSFIDPPVTYGTLPSNCRQIYPAGGATPAGLTSGVTYKVWLVTDEAVTASQTFTP